MVKKVATLHQKHSLLPLFPPFPHPSSSICPASCASPLPLQWRWSSGPLKIISECKVRRVSSLRGTQSGGGGGRATVNLSEETIPSVRQGERPHTTGSGTSNQSCKSSSAHIFRTAAERGGYPGLKAALVPIILNLIEVARLEARNIDRE